VKVVLQRVTRAEVRVGGERVAAIGGGLLILVCAMRGDGDAEAERLAAKVAHFKCFPAPDGSDERMCAGVLEAGGAALVVSQFTLAADGRKGRRPSFDDAAPPGEASRAIERFAAALEGLGLPVERGVFGARMEVELVNDGPVTFVLEESVRPGGRRPPSSQALA